MPDPTTHNIDDDREFEIYGLFKIPKLPPNSSERYSHATMSHEEWEQRELDSEAQKTYDYFERQLDDHWNY